MNENQNCTNFLHNLVQNVTRIKKFIFINSVMSENIFYLDFLFDLIGVVHNMEILQINSYIFYLQTKFRLFIISMMILAILYEQMQMNKR